MKLKELTLSKTLKIALPSYSNTTVTMGMVVTVEENEKPDYDGLWKRINLEIEKQIEQDVNKYERSTN